MRASFALSATVSLLALSCITSPAFAQTAPTTPPGVPESSTQDDDPSGATAEQNDADATAAESAGPLETGSGENEVVVTGTRIARPEFAYPNPVQAYTAETIRQSGETNLTEFLAESPALINSLTSEYTAGSESDLWEVGLNLLDLRNLGTDRTLVLVNGRRHVGGYPGTAAVDVNMIPQELIDRVDVLTGGASAIYGADGVSGVVNFVLKRNFEGIAARAQAGISDRGDAGTRYAAITAGQNFAGDRGNVAISYEFNKSDRLPETSRLDYGRTAPSYGFAPNPNDPDDDPSIPDRILVTDHRWADSSINGAVDIGSIDPDTGLFVPGALDFLPDFDGDGSPYDRGTPVGSGWVLGGTSTPVEIYYGDLLPYNRRHVFNGLASFEVSPALRFFAEGKFAKTRAKTYSQPDYDFYTYLLPDNAYLLDRFGDQAPAGAYVTGRDSFDYGRSNYSADRKTVRGVVGVDGQISRDLKYEVSYVYGSVKQRLNDRNNRIVDRYFAAIDAVVDPATGQTTCRINLPGETEVFSDSFNTFTYSGAPYSFSPGECIPLNILGSGAGSQAAEDWVFADAFSTARVQQRVLSGSLSGNTASFFNFPGGPVGFAVGAEYRKEQSRTNPDDMFEDEWFGYGYVPDEGKFNVKEVFGEVNLPILKDLPFAQTLSIGGAVRLSDYSSIGKTTTWKLDGVYAPVRDISFRGTYSRAVRAPNISELYAGAGSTGAFIEDPCDIDYVDRGTSSRAANCAAILEGLGIDPSTFNPANDPTSPENSSIAGLQGGNAGLAAETAKTWTAGVVLRPRFVPGLNVALDWYSIKLKDAVNYPSAQELFELCVDQPSLDNPFCAAVSRDADSGYASNFLLIPQNVAQFRTAGADLALNYRLAPSNWGSFNLRVAGGYLHRLQFVPTIGAEVDDDRQEAFAPKFSANGDLTWTKGPVTLNYGINWFSKTRRYEKETTDVDPDILEEKYLWYKERWEHDVQAAFQVNERFGIYAGANNVWNQKPDVGASSYPISKVGRQLYVGTRIKL
jgi:outer membrane receptor protein involved in Fe transport